MTAENILDLIGTAKDAYVEAAMQTRTVKAKRLPVRKILLVAALVSMILFLVGCTVTYVLHLQDLKIGQSTYVMPKHLDEDGNRVNEQEIVRDVISLQGIAGTPQFLAGQEWFAFEKSYDPDNTILFQADEQGFTAPDEYDAYFLYSQEMVDKVDEILRKYDLKPAGPEILTEESIHSVFFDTLGIRQLHRENAAGKFEYQHGYFYACGNFYMEFRLALDSGTELLGGVTYSDKDYFHPRNIAIQDLEGCTQWNFRSADGQDVLVVEERDWVQLLCQRTDGFLSVSLHSMAYGEDGKALPLSKEDIRKAADAFDYSVKPQKPDMEKAAKEVDAYYEKLRAEQQAYQETQVNPFELESYQEYIDYVISKMEDPKSFRYGQNPKDTYFHLQDINGDGVEDLLLGQDPDSFYSIMTMREGKIHLLFDNGMGDHFLCENQILGFHGISDQGSQSVYYYQMEGDTFRELVNLEYDPEKETWLRQTYDEWGYMEPISDAEAAAVTERYTRVELEGKPLTQFPRS